ncbi:hypothetical protein BGZ96_003542 [Linnemannia gamsii]|uniref:SH3 domain-containing protein n=1 Tax=Linnemannia gamsii TaxID=64522 RepID=A0ABQ7K8L7_9FUNG|nr:hypothetical protein BGZ96_003542 [Linnemannia gamsii]
MASSPGLNGHPTEEQFSHVRNNHTNNNSNLNHNNHITNGSSRGVRLQQNQDAIVPASDQDDNDDDSTDEDEAYNSYMQEQEQQQQHQQQIKHNLGLTRQLQPHYGSVGTGDQDMADEDEDEDDYASHRQHQQQQPHHHQHQQLRQIQQQYQLQQQQHLNAYKSQAMNIQQLLRQDQSQDHDMAGTDSHEEDEYYQQNPHHDPHLQHQIDIDMQRNHHDDLSEDIEDDDDDFDDDVDEDEVDEEMMDEEDDDEGSEVISLTEDDIDFNLVYAFHTFVATQEGQASVVRNDSLMLLEDANVYWWLVRVLKTGVIGYIPAENIETPFERLARLNTYRNVSLTAPSPEWGTFDEHIQPLDPAVLEQRAANRRSVVFTAQNEFLEASETEWTDEEDEEGGWYEDGGEEGEEEEDEEEVDGAEEEHEDEHESMVEDAIHGATTSIGVASTSKDDNNDNQGYGGSSAKSELQLEAERVQQEILSEQRKHEEMLAMKAMEREQDYNHRTQQAVAEDEDNESEDEEVQVTNRYRKPLLDEDDLLFSSEKRVISLTPPIARDDNLTHQESPSKARNLRFSGETTPRHSPQPSQQLQQSPSQQQRQASPLTIVRSSSIDSEEEAREKMKKSMAERKEAKISAILGNGPQEPIVRKSKEEYERGLPPEATVIKKPGKFKSLFSVGKSSKDKERKEKERLEKERLKNLAKSSASTANAGTNSNNSGISNNLFRARSNSNGSVGSSSTAPSSAANPLSPTLLKKEESQQDFMTLRVYPGNVDFGASMYKTVVITPATMSSDVAHQAVVKFRLAPDGTASTGDFYLTVKGVDGDETVLQATDKPMTIYQSLTAHLTTPLPANHRLSISSVSSMMSVNSTGSHSSSSNPAAPGTPTLRRTGSGRAEPQQRSIRFLLNKKIKRAGSVSLAGSAMPSTPTTPTTPQEDFFWVKVVCQAQDLPQSMVLLEGMGSAIEKADSRTHGQSFATKVEHWIPMHSTSNAGDVIFKTLEKVGIRSGVVDGVPEHVLVAKRLAVPHGLVIEYQLGLKLANGTTKKLKLGEEISLPPQVPLAKCFEDHQLQPIHRSPKADVASMPLHPDYVFFVRKATKSLQAEMKFVQERLQQTQTRSRVPSTLQTSQAGRTSIDTTDSQANGLVSPTSSGFSGRNSIGQKEPNTAPAIVTATASGRLTGATSPPIRIPRRTDSVIMSPTSTPIRANSFDNSSGRPSPTLSAQNMMTTQQIHPPQISRTPTPDRHQQVRTRSPSISQGSPSTLARPLQAPSPAPSNLSSHGEQQEGSRSSTPERLAKIDRPERQRAISPSLTHGPSPLSMSAIMLTNDSSNSPVTPRKETSTTSEEPSTPTLSSSPSPSNRLNVKKNATQGVDILLQKGIVRSSRSQSQYQYQFIPFGGGEEIDITEIIEDVLGDDSDNEDEDDDDESPNHSHNQHVDQHPGQEQDLASMSRRERVAAAVARASQAVAAGKERRRATAKARPASGSGVSLRSSPSRDWDRLEQLSGSARGGETLLKLERALAVEAVAGSGSSTEGPSSRNLPSPMSLTSSSPSSPTLNKRISDAEVQIVSVTTMGQNNGLPGSVRNYSPIPQVMTKDGDINSRAHSPGRSSPSTPTSGYVRPTLLANLSSLPNSRGTSSNPSSPSSGVAPHLHHTEGRSYSPLPRPLQTPSPAALPHQLSIRTSLASSSSADPTSPSTDESSATSPLGPLPQFTTTSNNVSRTRSASASVAEGGFRKGGHVASASESAVSLSHNQHDPWLLASDYNTGMQDLLTLVRGGRSSSVSTGAPSSLRGGFTFGKDGKIVQGPISPTHHGRHRMFSSQANSPTSSSSSLLYNNTSNTSTTNHHHYHKDTPAHDRHLDDTTTTTTTTTTSSGTTSANHNDHVYLTNNNYNMIDGAAAADDEVEQYYGQDDDEPRIWIRTDRRLRDVRSECHPEVFECWREVDADLDKVEREAEFPDSSVD